MPVDKTPRRRAAGEPRGRPLDDEPVEEPVAQVPVSSAPPTTSEADAGRLELSDLEALASMDPGDLAALMDVSVGRRKPLEPGSKVQGVVTRVGQDTVFVDLGAKSEGLLERGDLPGAAPGDEVTAFVVSVDEGGTILTMRLQGAAAAEHLADAAEAGIPVEGRVDGRNPGGYDVRIGTVRAFCPASQISRLPGVDPDSFVGQVFEFKVLEAGDRVVVSRRALQEEEAELRAVELWKTLAEGQPHRGVVRSVQPFGFFVDIGGVDGLVPRSEIGWGQSDDPREVVQVGQGVEVVVLSADRDTRRLTLSAKALEDDPWREVGDRFVPGGVYRGTVRNIAEFGAFVALAPGLDGLLHRTRLGKTPPARGDELEVRILDIDHERRRLSLALAEGGADDEDAEAASAWRTQQAEQTRSAGFGTFGDLLGGALKKR